MIFRSKNLFTANSTFITSRYSNYFNDSTSWKQFATDTTTSSSKFKNIHPKHLDRHVLVFGNWKNIKNQRKFLDWIAAELKFRSQDDWYTISKDVILKKGGYLIHK